MTDTARRRPGDTWARPLAWQVAAGPGDGRWGVQATRYEYMNFQCRYCGDSCPQAGHPRELCLACGTPQCGKSRDCIVCLAGFVGSPPWREHECGYAKCDGPAVAKAPRVGRVCLAHLNKPVIIRGGNGRVTLADAIGARLLQRDLGGHSWQKLTWFGPPKRYAVRRWHDDGRTGWTTGQDPQGFETAGQADREAAAWMDPRAGTDVGGWHAVRVELTAEVAEQIRARYPEPEPVDAYAEYGFDHAWERD